MPAIIQKIALQAESEKCFQIWFFLRFGEKKWQRSEHAHGSYPGLSVQPLYGAWGKESSGTGLKIIRIPVDGALGIMAIR